MGVRIGVRHDTVSMRKGSRSRPPVVTCWARGALGTGAIMRAAGGAKVWRWQEGSVGEGVDGVPQDKRRSGGKAPLPTAGVKGASCLPCPGEDVSGAPGPAESLGSALWLSMWAWIAAYRSAVKRCDRLAGPPLRRPQHDLRAPRQALRRLLRAHQRLQFRSFPLRQRDLDQHGSSHTALIPDERSIAETYRSVH
jgi:hypothetical protein